MILNYKNLKNEYIGLFKDQEKCDFVLTDVLFAFNEIYSIIKDEEVSTILEIGSGTSILLNELSKLFPEKKFFGLDPHKRGYSGYEEISKKIESSKNLSIIHDDLTKFKPEYPFDLIFSFNVFEHVQDQHDYIKRIDNLLSVSGKSVILCPNYDFPYEPHFIIPIILNKETTFKFFKSKIINHEKKTGEIGLWNGLNFCSKKKLSNFLNSNNFNFKFDGSIKERFFKRIDEDQSSYFKKRQGIVAIFAKIAKSLYLDKIIFDIFKIPFPYMKLIIEKKKR